MINEYTQYIKKIREDKKISQAEIADQLGISRTSYIALEQGKRDISFTELEKLSKIFGFTLQDFEQQEIPDYGKYKQMIHAFLRLNSGIPKTKLAKLLYFADFAWYYNHLESMSGMQYRKIQYGPVADSYFRLIDEMYDEGELEIKQTSQGAMIITETRAGKKESLDKISKEQSILIKDIDTKWKNKKTEEIVKFTHKQMPYLFAEDNNIVSYEVFGQENPEDIY